MTSRLRVERALRLLPPIDIMDPLRALLVSTPRTDDQSRWTSSGPYLTIGKHGVDVEAFRQRVTALLPQLAAHMATLFDAYVRALAAIEENDGATAVAALGDGGLAEASMHRIAQAAAWYEVAFRIAAELGERGPEIEMLDRLGKAAYARAKFDDAARYHQRALILAEDTFDHESTVQASIGLGHAALARNELGGAHAWYLRALRQSDSAEGTIWTGRLEHYLGSVEWLQGNPADARVRLRRAREILEPLGAHAELARLMCTIGRVECGLNHFDEGIAAGREALAWTQRPGVDESVRVRVFLLVADLYVSANQLLDADHELRRAEESAIQQKSGEALIEVYVAMGRLSALRSDETGFVFFEQAGELCRALAPDSALEGRLYEEYGNFRLRFGENEEGTAYLERARQIFEAAGDAASLARLKTEIASLSA